MLVFLGILLTVYVIYKLAEADEIVDRIVGK